MSYIYDGILVVAFALIVWRGWRRGILSTLLSVAGWAVALFIIFGWGTSWSENLYADMVEPWAINTVEKAIPAGTVEAMNSGADAVVKVQGVLDNMTGLLGGQHVKQSQANAIESALRQDSQSLAENITGTVLQPVLFNLVRFVIFLAILIIVLLLFRMLSRLTIPRDRGDRGVLSRTNQLLGGILGVLEGMAVVYALSFVIYCLAKWLDTDWLNITILSKTILLSRLV